MTRNLDQIKGESAETQRSLQKKLIMLIKQGNSEKIKQLLDENPNIKKLNLKAKELGNEGANLIGKVLRTNQTLTTLSLWNNKISVEGGKAIAQALLDNQTLIELNLGANTLGNEGIKAISKVLHHNQTLKRLNLCHNEIGDDGVKTIAEALLDNQALITLDLSANIITTDGAIALDNGLKFNKTLTKLCVWIRDIDNYSIIFDNYVKGKKSGFFEKQKRLNEEKTNFSQITKNVTMLKVYDEMSIVLDKFPIPDVIHEYRFKNYL